ncbi:MAG: hypothetical protein ACKO14_14660 [Armatimonadota bacterium]
MRNVVLQVSPPTRLTDPFPVQWLRSIQSSGHPTFESLLGGTWRDIYISEGWKIASDGVIRQGGHSIEFGIKVGKSIKPLRQLPVFVKWCWPRLSIHILSKSTPDRLIQVIPALFTDRDAASAVAIEISAKEAAIAVRTRGLYASTGTLPTSGGWTVIPAQPVAQRIVFSRTKPTQRIIRQFAHASACVKCLNDSDIPTWLTTAMAPALQYSTTRPDWIQALLGFPISQPDPNAIAIQQCRTVLTSGVETAIADFISTLDSRHPTLQPELGLVLKWLIANHPASKLNSEVVASQLAMSPIGSTPIARALAFAATRIPLIDKHTASALTKDVRSGRLPADAGMAAAIFASSGDVDLAAGAASLVQPSTERTLSLPIPCEWLALLYASPASLGISGCLSIDMNPSTPFGVRSPILTSGFAGQITSRKDIEASRVRISVASGTISLRSLRTWRTDTATASALCLHLGKDGRSTSVNAAVDIHQATGITFPKSEHITAGESLVTSTVGIT